MDPTPSTAVVIFFIMYIAAVTEMRCAKTAMVRYLPLEDMNNTMGVISTYKTTRPAECARYCVLRTNCESFFYNTVTSECQVHEALFMTADGASDQKGLQYYYIIKERRDWCPVEKGFQLLDIICVKFHTDTKTWYKAKQTCESYSPYSRLVVLDNQEKNELVKSSGKAINDMFVTALWIGLGEVISGEYKWVDGGDLTFTDWSSDVHHRTERECVVLHRKMDWKWTSRDCTIPRHYICEVEMDINLYHKMMDY